jgi:C-terminal processing protease CtpA/Prc
MLIEQNCSLEKAEVLADHIGYLKLDSFPDMQICGATLRAAIARVSRADAIIFDLRENAGGFPDTVAELAAPLFDHAVPWYNPRATPSSTMLSPARGSKLANKPVYILTSKRTFSGAEHFTYNLKMLKRATVIGETTGGAAHEGVFHRVDDHFGMGVPESKITNPYGKPDWSAVGVEPDVKVKAADALQVAEKMAAKQIGR